MRKDKVHNRVELMSSLKRLCRQGGEFACLLGGKSTGKSYLLNHLAKSNPALIYIDMRGRHNGNMLAAVISYLSDFKSEILFDYVKESGIPALLELFSSSIEEFLPIPVKLNANAIADIFRKHKSTDSEIIADLLYRYSIRYGFPTLIIDEANIAFAKGDKTAIADLTAFTKLTKQDKKINVLLCTSEYGFPYHLSQMSFNTSNLSELIFMGEISPKDMFVLLSEHWKIGENLAISLIENYGGHILNVSRVIGKLALNKEEFDPYFGFGVDASSFVVRALNSFKEDAKKRSQVCKYLRGLAQTGFVPISYAFEDEVCRSICLNNVGGVVSVGGMTVGLPKDVWTGRHKQGLVPSNHSMRLLIANELYYEERTE